MAAPRTEVTEITTGLGMLGFPSLERALAVRPRAVLNVESAHYERLEAAWRTGKYEREFDVAWRNGVEFARSTEGLRGRPPWSLEWKGSHKPPGYEQIPADLRVDHVYLISCKYGSNILTNSSPANLFSRLLADRQDAPVDWYLEVAPADYQAFYVACRSYLDDRSLPVNVASLTVEHRDRLKRGIPRSLSGDLLAAYLAFADAVATASAARWKQAMARSRRRREETLWRLLRLQSAPYFVLGESAGGTEVRYRVGTPWDFRNRFRFRSFDAWPDLQRRQPVVQWHAEVTDNESGQTSMVDGHVEVRWSHGRFAQAPEAKVYLDTPHHKVPGYVPLTPASDAPDRLRLTWNRGE
ncbi:MAG TPA: hypothetical protein VLG28_10315 [Acidimicrobiia bacterium]|nr:hypothetical protein [Acidimicrobiia bacterium]